MTTDKITTFEELIEELEKLSSYKYKTIGVCAQEMLDDIHKGIEKKGMMYHFYKSEFKYALSIVDFYFESYYDKNDVMKVPKTFKRVWDAYELW